MQPPPHVLTGRHEVAGSWQSQGGFEMWHTKAPLAMHPLGLLQSTEEVLAFAQHTSLGQSSGPSHDTEIPFIFEHSPTEVMQPSGLTASR
jgi:hypothetical protein